MYGDYQYEATFAIGNDFIFGGTGNDYLFGSGGNDDLNGGADNDILEGGTGDDLLRGGTGEDVFRFDVAAETGFFDEDTILDFEDGVDRIDLFGYTSLDSFSIASVNGGNDTEILVNSHTITLKNVDASLIDLSDFLNPFPAAGQVDGTNGNDILDTSYTGDPENDVIVDDSAASNIVYGYGGNDTITLGAGTDEAHGGAGDDVIQGGQGIDILRGGEAIYQAENGSDTYIWSKNDGNDTIEEFGESLIELDTLRLEDVASNDVEISRISGTFDIEIKIISTGEKITVNSQLLEYGIKSHGLERIEFSDSTTWSRADIAANVRTEGTSANDTLTGTDASDNLYAKGGDDLVEGGNGDDVAFGGDGNDILRGGDGDDTIDGNGGDDIIEGGAGNDTLAGGTGVDYLYGGDGDDIIRGGGGADFLYGEDGEDEMYGTSGEDEMHGGEGDDLLEGLSQSDSLFGGNGNDILRGGDGYDDLSGGAGDDVLVGGNGIDRLEGGAGVDILRGNAQNDTFVFNSVSDSTATSSDVIDGTEGIGSVGGDVIDLSSIDANILIAGDSAFSFYGLQTNAAGIALGAGALWLEDSGTQTRLFGNTDNDGAIDFAVKISDGDTIAASDYLASDFLL